MRKELNGSGGECIPMMPCTIVPKGHRETYPEASFKLPMLVARPVGKKETRANQDALDAESKEWNRLRDKKTWASEDTEQEWDDVVEWA